ncbi:MAG: ADP-glyceromanno-heptose 6-epimerase [Alphaproteobacteria bacterium]|nr:ADP-glyceromanno-heptose 6-epimerase [Alphaproteobacteria bacterium]
MIVVTGGAGFIGSNLVAALEAREAGDIVVVDRLGRDRKWRNIAKRELADIVPPEELFAFLERNADKLSLVFHLGAISTTTETDGDAVIAANFRLSLALLDWCTRNRVRLIYASSAATYGDGRAGFDDDGAPAALARLRPLNLYGWSKHLFDRRIARLAATGAELPPQWVGLKFFNVYGPNEYHKDGQISVVLKNFREIEATGRAVLFRSHRPDYADGGQLRDFIWVGDCVEAMVWLVENRHVSGLFNLGTGTARSFADLAAAVFGALGRAPAIDYVDMPATLRAQYQYRTEATMGRLRRAGYTRAFTPLEDGVARYVRGFLAAADPYA